MPSANRINSPNNLSGLWSIFRRIMLTLALASLYACAPKASDQHRHPMLGPSVATLSADDDELLNAEFEGNDRLASKTSIAQGDIEESSPLVSLLNSLPADNDMPHHPPPLTKA